MIPAAVQRLKQPAHARSERVTPSTVEGVTLPAAHDLMDRYPPYVVLLYAENKLHGTVGPFLRADLGREWALANLALPCTGFRLVPVSPVRPLLPAPPLWSR